MKKIIYHLLVTLFVTTLTTGCEKENETGEIQSIGIKEAVYVSANKAMQLTLKDNATLQLTPLVTPSDAANPKLVYSNKNAALMSVSQDGVITGKAPGTDTLTISTTDGSNIQANYRVIITSHIVKATGISVTATGRNMTLETGKTFDLKATVTVTPADVTDNSITFASLNTSVASVDANGIVTAVAEGATVIRITTADGSAISTDCNVTVINRFTGPLDLSRSGWKVMRLSHVYIPDNTINGSPESLIDDNNATCLSLLKPGKTYSTGGVDYVTPAGDIVYFILDLGKEQEFDFLRIRHRNTSQLMLRVLSVSLYGSNTGTTDGDFTLIGKNMDLPNAGSNATEAIEARVEFAKSKYRYIKMTYDKWDNASGSSMQIAEFYLGNIIK